MPVGAAGNGDIGFGAAVRAPMPRRGRRMSELCWMVIRPIGVVEVGDRARRRRNPDLVVGCCRAGRRLSACRPGCW